MKLVALVISLGIYSGSFAQSLTASFNEDGSFQITDIGRKGTSVQKVDNLGRTTASIHYFTGGQRLKMSSHYTYENNLPKKHLGYIYTQGHEKDIYQYDASGNILSLSMSVSQDQKTWKEEVRRSSKFDHKNNRIYFRSWSTRGGYVNALWRTTYNYSTGIRKVVQENYDKSDRLISTENYGGKMGKYAMANGPYVFNIETDGSNLRENRVVYWTGSDINGNHIEKVFMNSMALYRTYDSEDRLIQLADGRPRYDDDNKLYYSMNQVLNYKYQGNRLIEINSRSYKQPRERRVFDYSKRGQIKMTLYRQSENGNWSKYETQSYKNLDRITPPRLHGNSFITQEPEYEVHNPSHTGLPHESHGQVSPIQSPNSLTDAVQSVDNAGPSGSINVAKADAEKLAHIVRIIEHRTGKKVSNDQLVTLALQLLIAQYQDDLRSMNNDYLKEQVDIFD